MASHSARFTCPIRPSAVSRAMPMGASAKAVRKRSSLSRSAPVISCSSTNTDTFDRSTSGSNGLNR